MPTTKKKSRKMDRKLVALSQKWEVRTILKKYKSLPKEVILNIAHKAGRSRVMLYKMIADELERRNNSRTES